MYGTQNGGKGSQSQWQARMTALSPPLSSDLDDCCILKHPPVPMQTTDVFRRTEGIHSNIDCPLCSVGLGPSEVVRCSCSLRAHSVSEDRPQGTSREKGPVPVVVSALGDINSQTRTTKKHPGMGTFIIGSYQVSGKPLTEGRGVQPRAKSIACEFITFWSSDTMCLGMLLLPTLLLGLCVIPEQLDLKECSRIPSSIPREGLLPRLEASPGSWLGVQPLHPVFGPSICAESLHTGSWPLSSLGLWRLQIPAEND